ncbi:unnamed protein product, partial [Symbiodinium microadriaticum]
VVDMALGDHPLNKSSLEINATVGFAYSYLAWNFFCWWLLRTPPYPLQKRFFELGIPWAVFAYAVRLLPLDQGSQRLAWCQRPRGCGELGLHGSLAMERCGGKVPGAGSCRTSAWLELR